MKFMRSLENRNSVGYRLKCERERLGLTQAEFGKRIGVGRLSVLRYEVGDRCPNADYLVACEKIGLDVYFILCGSKAQEKIDMQSMEKAVIFLLKLVRDLRENPDPKVMTAALIHFYRSMLRDADRCDDHDTTTRNAEIGVE